MNTVDETSPALTKLQSIFSNEDLSSMLGYKERSTRADYLVEMVSCLERSYTPRGVRKWFFRSRTRLDGRTPAEYLGADWHPADRNANKVKELALSTLA